MFRSKSCTFKRLANNVIIHSVSERKSDKYIPILIDFGKSTKASSNLPLCAKKKADERCRSYLAPEVSKYRQYSVASDIYSLGRMLKAISKLMGFYDRVRLVIKNATKESPHDRSHLDQLINELAAIHF